MIIIAILKTFYYCIFLFIVHYYLHKRFCFGFFFGQLIVFMGVTFVRGICNLSVI